MSTRETVRVEGTLQEEPACGGTNSTPTRLDRFYRGERGIGDPIVLVTDGDGTESMLAPAFDGFDWGWSGMDTRRLARALLIDVTGREPPAWARDAFATEELAHFDWRSFLITGRDLLEWIEYRGYELADWPPVNSTPSIGPVAPSARLQPARRQRVRSSGPMLSR
jgi:hypothetical protein